MPQLERLLLLLLIKCSIKLSYEFSNSSPKSLQYKKFGEELTGLINEATASKAGLMPNSRMIRQLRITIEPGKSYAIPNSDEVTLVTVSHRTRSNTAAIALLNKTTSGSVIAENEDINWFSDTGTRLAIFREITGGNIILKNRSSTTSATILLLLQQIANL